MTVRRPHLGHHARVGPPDVYVDRAHAGQVLAAAVMDRLGPVADCVVVGIPRGGVPVAAQVARALRAGLDAVVVRKIGAPEDPELAIGAVGEGGVAHVDDWLVERLGIASADLDVARSHAEAQVRQRLAWLRAQVEPLDLEGRTVVVVDDGLATGATAAAACTVARARGARRIVLAVPVAPEGWEREMGPVADDYVCPVTPPSFRAVGLWYERFPPVDDDEVMEELLLARRGGAVDERTVEVHDGAVVLQGVLAVPHRAEGRRPLAVAVFAHGAGSSRTSVRNRQVAAVLQEAGIATLLVDLVAPGEPGSGTSGVDERTLADMARRLVAACALARDAVAHVGCALVGSSTGAAVAVMAAAMMEQSRSGGAIAVVSRGGRLDMAGPALRAMRAPLLMIVGGDDADVVALNREAAQSLHAPWRLEVVPGAGHLFAEPGTLQAAATLARDWIVSHAG